MRYQHKVQAGGGAITYPNAGGTPALVPSHALSVEVPEDKMWVRLRYKALVAETGGVNDEELKLFPRVDEESVEKTSAPADAPAALYPLPAGEKAMVAFEHFMALSKGHHVVDLFADGLGAGTIQSNDEVPVSLEVELVSNHEVRAASVNDKSLGVYPPAG